MDKKQRNNIFAFVVIILLIFLYSFLQMFLGRDLLPLGFLGFFLPYILLVFLGIALLFLAVKYKAKGKLKLFLVLTGVSAVSLLLFIILHNLTSALLSTIFDQEIEEPIFFILAVIICPIGILIGSVGSFVTLLRNKY